MNKENNRFFINQHNTFYNEKIKRAKTKKEKAQLEEQKEYSSIDCFL